MPRIVIIGTSCAGKSTLARQLAEKWSIPHIELDALYWEKNWTPASDELFRERVSHVVAAEEWVLDGNYSGVRDMVWDRAEMIIWLDYSLPVLLSRAVQRTVRRSLLGEECCNGNRESLRRAFSRDSILLWVLTTYQRRRREFHELLPEMSRSGRQVIVLRSPSETQCWLSQVRSPNGLRL